MMTTPQSEKQAREDRAIDEISSWYVKLNDEGASDEERARHQVAFQNWLNNCPENKAALLHMQNTFGLMDEVWTKENIAEDLLAPEPEKVLQENNIVPLSNSFKKSPLKRALWPMIAIAASLLITLTTVLNYWSPDTSYTTETTSSGEQRTVQLSDGSTLYLNTETKLQYALSEEQRVIHLNHGEVYFEVAKNPSAPFIVSVGGKEVKAVGTAFNIKNLNGITAVTVTEGIVDVGVPEEKSPLPKNLLTIGQSAHYSENSPVNVQSNVSIDVAEAWRHQKLLYQNISLQEMVDDLNRYFKQKVTISGKGDLRISAAMPLSDQKTVLNTLAKQLPLSITENENGTFLIRVISTNK